MAIDLTINDGGKDVQETLGIDPLRCIEFSIALLERCVEGSKEKGSITSVDLLYVIKEQAQGTEEAMLFYSLGHGTLDALEKFLQGDIDETLFSLDSLLKMYKEEHKREKLKRSDDNSLDV